MLDINLIREEPEKIKENIKNRNANPGLVDDFLALDGEWRKLTSEIDNFRAEQKKLGEERKIEEAKGIKAKIQELDDELKVIEESRRNVLYKFPNLSFDSVPAGKTEDDNVVLRDVGEKPEFGFEPKDYIEIGEGLDLIDTGRAAKVSGSRFGYLKGAGALLEFALVKLAMDTAAKKGFVPVIPPVMIKSEMMKAMGYIDRTEDRDETYYLEPDDLYLVGTSEQSIGPMHADEIFEEKDLPKRYISFSTCFRREAGSYGKDTRGILRVHQFDKIEMFIFCHPDNSKEEHKLLLSIEEELMQALKLPYHVLEFCAGGLGSGPAAAKYDIEVWLPGQNNRNGQYRETHSTSNCTDFQSRRLNIRYRNKEGKVNFIHMLNGTAFSQRPILAILENYQTKEGNVVVPEVLREYLGTDIIKPRD
ncbi:MAG: serine--tRNA ligase [Candidatus Wolfebacteria bacterium]|nr:serine--tRNA ligase [Candidatus Wolfebacteria bacterium]